MAGNQPYDITISNWNTYQPRKDLKSLSWIRIDSDIFFSENFFLLDNNQKILFFYVLTYAGKKNTDTYSFNPEFVSANLKIGIKQLNEGIEKLESLGIVHRSVTESSRIRTDACTTIRNDTNDTIHNVTIQDFTFDIEKIYSEIYPLKKGKQKGVASLAKQIKTAEQLEQFKIAVLKYKSSIKDPNYIKHFSTFANEWTDWLDKDAGKATIAPITTKQGSFDADPLAHHKAQIERFRNKEQSND